MEDPHGRPEACRNRLRDEGKNHPKSGCDACHMGGLLGCPHDGSRHEPGTDEQQGALGDER